MKRTAPAGPRRGRQTGSKATADALAPRTMKTTARSLRDAQARADWEQEARRILNGPKPTSPLDLLDAVGFLPLPRGPQHVLDRLARHADTSGGTLSCFPSVKRLASQMGVSVRQVQDDLRWLEDWGVITRTSEPFRYKPPRKGGGRRNRYSIVWPQPLDALEEEAAERAAQEAKRAAARQEAKRAAAPVGGDRKQGSAPVRKQASAPTRQERKPTADEEEELQEEPTSSNGHEGKGSGRGEKAAPETKRTKRAPKGLRFASNTPKAKTKTRPNPLKGRQPSGPAGRERKPTADPPSGATVSTPTALLQAAEAVARFQATPKGAEFRRINPLSPDCQDAAAYWEDVLPRLDRDDLQRVYPRDEWERHGFEWQREHCGPDTARYHVVAAPDWYTGTTLAVAHA